MNGIGARPAEIARTRRRDWLIRFAFGAGISGVAGLVGALAGPLVGGAFLAFPAILLASLTLVAEENGPRQARDEARGATFGAVGLLVFALVLTAAAPRWPLWIAFPVATAAWVVVSLGLYALTCAFGRDRDEPNHGPTR
ncbi:DUF3147 family protein [Rhizomonospora bruguierae]|uniref:DUF3147 family protein n=1 Tax=Rhizomonospora bruguierae TaxID=1581705 RepID=UPI001BCD6772|nr:DUF3147 family protein [Micromonospora sp. NBRC 107566]